MHAAAGDIHSFGTQRYLPPSSGTDPDFQSGSSVPFLYSKIVALLYISSYRLVLNGILLRRKSHKSGTSEDCNDAIE